MIENKYVIYNHHAINDGTIVPMFPEVFNKFVSNPEDLNNHPSLVIPIRKDSLIYKADYALESLALYKHRRNKDLNTKIIIDYSLEGLCYDGIWDINNIISMLSMFNDYNVNFSTDVLFVHNDYYNRYITSPIIKPLSIGKNISCDHHAIEAYSKCILTDKNLIDNTLVKDRNNGLNLLIGKLKAKHARFLTAYYFYKHDLLDPAVLGIHALPKDILRMMKKYPKYDDINFYNKIINYLGPADSVSLQEETNEGLTAKSGGWPFDPNIFKNSTVSYVCETYDPPDRGPLNLLITEKSYRPIINKHPFIVQGSSDQLRTIKSLGFETFSSIIDESYNEYDQLDYSHVEKTVLAAKDLLTKIPNNIDKVQEIVDYNYKHWLGRTKAEYDTTNQYLKNFINNII